MSYDKIHIIDSHTGGEPTRVVISGGPELGSGSLEERRARDAFRVRRVVENGAGRFLTHARRQYCNFSSNDYLGLSQHPAIVRAWQQGAEHYGVGSGGSGHVSGYTTAHQALEEALADWLGYPRALLFISGFAANQAVIAALILSVLLAQANSGSKKKGLISRLLGQ